MAMKSISTHIKKSPSLAEMSPKVSSVIYPLATSTEIASCCLVNQLIRYNHKERERKRERKRERREEKKRREEKRKEEKRREEKREEKSKRYDCITR